MENKVGGRPTSQKPVFVLKMRDEGHKNIDLGTKNEEKKNFLRVTHWAFWVK